MDDQRYKAFLVNQITSAQATIDAIRADFANPDFVQLMSYNDTCMASDEIAFQQVTIERGMETLATLS
jgi:hypothetical protein